MIHHAKINIPVPFAAIQEQVSNLYLANWKAHLNARDYEGEWVVLPLRSPGGNAGNIAPDLMGLHNTYLDTPLMLQCPAIGQLLDTLHCEKLSARLLNLKKGAIIKEHRDRELAFENGEVRLHFPVFTNPGVEFYINDERVNMQAGECWYINANLKHRVANYGDTDRIHLVVDCKVNKWLEDLFERSEKKCTDAAPDTSHWDKMIPQLRLIGTPAALAMADELENKLKAILPAPTIKNWIPYRLELENQEPVCHWLYLADTRFTHPFFSETIATCIPHRYLFTRSNSKSVSSPAMLREWSEGIAAVKPSAFIFHVSRCGSTLATQLLGINKNHIVLAEVPFFDELLRQQELLTDFDPITDLLKSAITLYGQKREDTETSLFIKTDSWHILYYKQLRQCYPDTPFILLYRKPDEVLRSHQQLRGMQAIPGLIDPKLFGFAPGDIEGIGLDEYMAKVLERYYECFLEINANDNRAFLINYNIGAFEMVKKIAEVSNTPISDDDMTLIEERSQFHSKYPGQIFAEAGSEKNTHLPLLNRAFELYDALEHSYSVKNAPTTL